MQDQDIVKQVHHSSPPTIPPQQIVTQYYKKFFYSKILKKTLLQFYIEIEILQESDPINLYK